MSDANINILGILNSVTADHTIAKAEQIEITLEDGRKTKIPRALVQYTKGLSSTDIEKFLDIATNEETKILDDHLFICTKALDLNYKVGHLYYYDGSKQMLTDITAGGSGGGSSDISLSVSFRQKNVETNTPITIPFTWTSNNTGYGLVYCLIDGQIKERLRQQPGTSEWVIPSLERGIHELVIYVVDSGNQTSNKWIFSVSAGSLEIVSQFDDSKIFKTGDDIFIPYEVYTNDKDATLNLLYNIDENEYTKQIGSNFKSELIISSLIAGNHIIKIKVESTTDKGTTYSNILTYNVLIATEGVLYAEPVGKTDVTIKENEKISLMIKTTYLGATKFSAYFTVYELKGSDYVESTNIKIPAAKWVNGINSFVISFDKKGFYQIKATVVYNESEVPITKEVMYTINVQETELYTITEVLDRSLMLHLSASGKSNNDLDKNIWKDTSVQELTNAGISINRKPVTVKMNNFNYSSNGWLPDEKGQSHLVIDSGASVEIDLKPFEKEVSADGEDGFTFEIEYSTKDILDHDARVVSCFNGQNGFWIDTEYATLSNQNSKTKIEVTEKKVETDIVTGHDENGNDIYLTYTQFTQTGPFQTPFPSNRKNRIAFVINRGKADKDGNKQFGDYQFSCMNIYVNGVLTSVEKISDFTDLISTKFENNGMKIMLGCDNNNQKHGYCEIYNIRAYKRALSMEEILINAAADIEDPKEQSAMIIRNELRKDAVSISDLPVMYFILKPEDAKRMSKKTKVWGKIDYRPEDNSKAFTSFMRCSWQGTSSLAYAVKNYKIKLYSDIVNGVGKTKLKYDLGNGIKESTFCLKADYMDSAHMRNTGTANFVSDLGTAPCPAQEYIPACRTAIYGFPILLYMVPPKDDTVDVANLEPDFDKQELLGVFNFNLDKGCTDSLSLYTKNDIEDELSDDISVLDDFKSNYSTWDCISLEGSANSDTTAGAFASIDDTSIFSDFELRFEDMDDLEDEGPVHYIGNIRKTESALSISGINVELDGVYDIDTSTNTLKGLRFDLKKQTPDLAETVDGKYELEYDFKYKPDDKAVFEIHGNSIIFDENFNLKLDRRYSHMKKLIRWVKDSPEEKFKAEFKKHFDLPGTIDYFLTVFVLLMADNLGKNCMWNTWGPISRKKREAAPSGTYAYTQEELRSFDNYIWCPQFYDMDTCIGLDNSGNMRFDVYEEIEPGIFNTSNSVFWTKFRKVFYKEIKERYIEMRQYSTKHSTYTLKSFLEYYYEKQIQKISERNFNRDIMQKYLKHDGYLFMCHGRQYEYFLRWAEQRLYFLDTVFEVGEAWGKQSTVRVEYGDFKTHPVVFKVKTYQPAYITISFTAAEGKTHKLKVPRNGEIEFSDYVNTATDQECIIYNAGNIKSIGDISPYTPKLVELSEMTKLTELSVGTMEHPNPNLTSIALSANTYLTKLVAENCTACSPTVDVSKCTNLKYVSTKGSSIAYVKLSEAGGALEELHLSHATTTLFLKNFMLLKEIDIEDLKNLTTLYVDNCPLVTGWKNPDGTNIDGFIYGNLLNKWKPESQSVTIDLNGYGKIDNYEFLDACSNLHEKYGMDNRRINIGGEIVYLGAQIPNKYSTYKIYFPNLLVKYPNVTNVSGMFKYYNNINAITQYPFYIKDPLTGNIRTEWRYYWRDPKEDKFSASLENGHRPLSIYDDDDQDIVANEIKDRLEPFERFLNMNEMFMGCEYIEKILPETFDNIDVSNATNSYMFSGCKNIKYIECPRFKHLDAFVFNDCIKSVIWIPRTVEVINQYAFLTNYYTEGKHSLLLFEKPLLEVSGEIPYARDCRFNISRDMETGRALRHEIISCPSITEEPGEDVPIYTEKNIDLYSEYFYHEPEIRYDSVLKTNKTIGSGKMIYSLSHYNIIDGQPVPNSDIIDAVTWNIKVSKQLHYKLDLFSNPLDIYEMMYGSMKKFNKTILKELSIPSFNLYNKTGENSSIAIYKEEVNLLKLFFDEVNSDNYSLLPQLKEINILNDKDNTISKFFLEDSNIINVRCMKELIKIDQGAFKDSKLESIQYEAVDGLSKYNLKYIGMDAFNRTNIINILIPDSVTYIGEAAFENNMKIANLHYSTNMAYVPIRCFANCNSNIDSPILTNISGFTSNITEFGRNCFDNAIKFQIIRTDISIDKYFCYWCEDNNEIKENRKFLEYFPKLTYIGDYAFRKVPNILTIAISPNIEYIGNSAFIPNPNEANLSTKLKWVDKTQIYSYNKLQIEANAFAGREFDWESNINGFNNILTQTVFIPKTVNIIGSNAFSPTAPDVSTNATLRFVLSDAVSKPEKWNNNFSSRELKRVFNYYSSLIDIDRANVKSLYFLLNDKTALYARLLSTAVSVEIPSEINIYNNKYILTELLDECLYEKDDALNSILFRDSKSNIKKIGKKIFKTKNISSISVNGTNLYIPKSVVEIGEGTPFKETTWFKNILSNNFVYLNNVCLGYSMFDKSLKDALEDTSNPINIDNKTEIIYDNAFKNEKMRHISLPTSLKKIAVNAFSNCDMLEEISFKPCENNLYYIGASAFANNNKLKEIHYTKALRHVGYGAFAGCNNIFKITFDQGCELDNSSQPLSPEINNFGVNTTITDLEICESMGSFFSPNGRGNIEFSLLSNVKNLVLGEYVEHQLELNPETGKYVLNLQTYYKNGYYQEGENLISKPIILETESSTFKAPKGTYGSDIDISNIKANTFSDEDVVRVILGYKDNELHKIIAKPDFVIRSNASKYRILFNNRATVTQPNN